MDRRSRTVALNAKALADTQTVFEALIPHRMGFVKVAAPLWEKQESGQWAVVDCICPASSETRAGTKDGSCASIGKHPLGKGWQHHPTTDWAIASRWLADGFSLGLYPLPGCRVLGLDEDIEDSLAFLFASVNEDLPLMDTMCDQMRGKYHLFLLVPDDYDIDTLPTGKFPGGDILRDGLVRQFVAPNGLHTAGRRQWNKVSDLMTASPALLNAIIDGAKAQKERISEAKTPRDPGWEVNAGDRHDFLLTNAAKLRNLGLTEEAIYVGLKELNEERCKPPKTEAEVRKIARDYAKKESVADEGHVTLNLSGGKQNGHGPLPPSSHLRVIAAYTARPVDWLWEGWMPRAEPVILEGLGGEGKSTFVVDLMSRLSWGDPMPDGAVNPFGHSVDSIYITGEDDPERVLKPRFLAARADMNRIHFWASEFTIPDDLNDLIAAINSQSAVRIVFIDPLFSHVSAKLNTGSDAEVRKQVMNPLREIAHALDVTVLIARHLNKKGGDDPILRGSGTYGGLTGAARSVIQSISDPEDPNRERKVIGVIKANYGRMPKPWLYTLESVTVNDGAEDIETSRIAYLGKHDKFIDQIVEAGRSIGAKRGNDDRFAEKRDAADRDLMNILMPGELEASLVKDAMTVRGHSRDATYDARARCHIVITRPGGNTGPYIWALPGQKPGRQGSFGLPE